MHATSPAGPDRTPGMGQPPVLRLESREGVTPSPLPPVRIFLGTEDAQDRAERIFIYSIERVRNPARSYHIYLMKNLPGFDRRFWRTGFTNYRFAIPTFAGQSGKAIYNDVDQVYLRDPAELFDLDLGEHGYRSVSADDTSVMLIDCARMAACWNLEAARRRHKHPLLRAASRQPDLWGALDPHWNARDLEYREGRSGLLHFTALHLQPWQPTPEDYSYHPHPLAEVFDRLERQADADDYRPFTLDRPSPWYQQALASWREVPPDTARSRAPASDWRISVGQAPPDVDAARVVDLTREGWPEDAADDVVAADCLERLPAEDVPWAIDALFRRTRRRLHLIIDPDAYGRHVHRDRRSRAPAGEWWRRQVTDRARGHPRVEWTLELTPVEPDGRRAWRADRTDAERVPEVWLLLEGEPVADAAGRHLAATVGWPHRAVSLDELGGTAPDLVLSTGPKGAARAIALRELLDDAPRLVHLGVPNAPLAEFDLILRRPEDPLPLRTNVCPLPRTPAPFDSGLGNAGRRHLEPLVANLPRPFVATFVGPMLTADQAADIAREAAALARCRGGSVLLAPHPDTSRATVEAITRGIETPLLAPTDDTGIDALEFFAGCCELADLAVASTDCGLGLAAASNRELPLFTLELTNPPARDDRWLRRLRRLLGDSTRRPSYRGTPRQQDWRGRLLDRWVAAGRIRVVTDPGALAASCTIQGLARPLTAPDSAAPGPRPPAVEPLIRARIRGLLDHRPV